MLFVFIIPIAIADITYSEAGEFDTDFIRGTGNFNAQLEPSNVTTNLVIIANPKKVPLINDLDGDGVQEIIVLNGLNINIFQNKTLDIAATLTLSGIASERFSNMITFDIDGDSFIEIILVGEKAGIVHILEYNSSSLTLQATLNMSAFGLNHLTQEISASDSGLVTIGCESANRCLIAYADQQDTGFAGSPESSTLSVAFMNSTFLGHELFLKTPNLFSTLCPPKIRTMAKADYDLDTDVEFIFTYSEPDVSSGDSGDDVNIFWINVESNQSVTLENNVFTTEVGEIITNVGSSDFMCDNALGTNAFRSAGGFGTAFAGKLFTAPLVFDADPQNAGLETILGVMTDNNEWIMIMYDSSGTKIREFPLIQESEGQILGNLFRAEVFDDSNTEQDFCALSQESTNNRISITCGSLQDQDGHGILTLQTIEFRSDAVTPLSFNLPFNISDNFDFFGIITHSGEHDETNSESEVISSYGVLELDTSTALGCGDLLGNNCQLNRIFAIPQIDGTVVPVDLDNIDLEDMLVMTSNNLFYIDDGFENAGVNPFCGEPDSVTGTCSEFTTNPCIDSVWKINSSVQITVTGKDPESDLVQVTATLYDGDVNEQSFTSVNVSSGTAVPFSFSANKTIGAGTLTLTAVDIAENPNDIVTVTKTFSVAPSGVEFGDCVTTVTSGVEAVVEFGILNISAEAALNEGLTDFVEGTSDALKVSPLIVALLLMLAFTIAVMTTTDKVNNTMITMNKVIFMLVGNAFIFIAAVIIGAIPFGVMLVIIIVGIFGIVLWARRQFTSNQMT